MLGAHAVRGQLAKARRFALILFEVIPAEAVEGHEYEGRVRSPGRRQAQQEQTEQDSTQGHATSVQFSRSPASGPWRGTDHGIEPRITLMGTDGLFSQEVTEEAEVNWMRVGAPDSISVKAALVGETPRDAA